MVAPTTVLRVDWENAGTFTATPADTVVPITDDAPVKLTRGASADYSGEAIGEIAFELDNSSHAYTPDRNWADNPSFEVSTAGWETAAIPGLIAAATSITQVSDSGAGAGTKAAEVVLPATANAGVYYRIPYRFLAGVTYSFRFSIKSMSGSLSIQFGIASEGAPGDIGIGGSITTSWATYTGTWTPVADRTDAVVFVRVSIAAAATLRIDAIGVNPGATANTYLEAPTKGQLVPGRPVHFYATHSAVNYPLWFGYIERITPNPERRTVTFTCYDPLRRMAETDIVVPALDAARSAREMRIAVLDDYERGSLNLLSNPSFETTTYPWSTTGGSLTRITTDAAPGTGSACAEWVPTLATHVLYNYARLAPLLLTGQVYRWSVWLRTVAGTSSWEISLATSSPLATRTVLVTTTWQRFTVTAKLTSDYRMTDNPLVGQVSPVAAGGTIRVDGAAITRGEALYPYADVGTGRYASFVSNPGMDVATTVGWLDAFANLIPNPSFETNTTGWSIAGDAFVGTATSLTRVSTDPARGSWHGSMVTTPSPSGAFYAITGTFKSGVAYRWSVLLQTPAAGATLIAGIGSQGTPANKSEQSILTVAATWTLYSGTWTPSADRTDAHFYVMNATGTGRTIYIDGAMVVRLAALPPYQDTGPGGGGSIVASVGDGGAPQAKYGVGSLAWQTTAVAGSGRLYDFNHVGAYFIGGQPYTLSLWLRATSSMPYKVGLGAGNGAGGWDEASATGTLTANTWTQVTVPWTPASDNSGIIPYNAVLFIYQTDATARTVYADGVRLIPGSVADEFEMGHWDIPVPATADVLLTTATLGGTALGALATLNELTLTRHWIRATMASPWYEYVTEDRDTFAAKTVVATFTEIAIAFENLEIDRASIVNVVQVSWSGGSEIYSDSDSVGRYGPRPGSAIDGSDFFPDRTIPDIVGPAILARYKDPRTRPKMTTENEWPNTLARDLNDVIAVTIDAFRIRSVPYVIQREDLTIDQSGLHWLRVDQLEEFPY